MLFGAVKSREEKMAEPIANDWKAINNRMQQIQAERRCPKCENRGWIPKKTLALGMPLRLFVCDFCRNPESRPPPPWHVKPVRGGV
jgi:hypothetical protein